MLESLMRIRLNGVNSLEAWPAIEYSRIWVKSHFRSDDPSAAKPPKKKDLGDYQSELEENEQSDIKLLIKERKNMLSNYVL